LGAVVCHLPIISKDTKITHLLTRSEHLNSPKVSSCRGSRSDVWILDADWLRESRWAVRKVDEAAFLLTESPKTTPRRLEDQELQALDMLTGVSDQWSGVETSEVKVYPAGSATTVRTTSVQEGRTDEEGGRFLINCHSKIENFSKKGRTDEEERARKYPRYNCESAAEIASSSSSSSDHSDEEWLQDIEAGEYEQER
jgi:hypothetical protein